MFDFWCKRRNACVFVVFDLMHCIMCCLKSDCGVSCSCLRRLSYTEMIYDCECIFSSVGAYSVYVLVFEDFIQCMVLEYYF